LKKREVFILSALAFTVGTVFGFLLSPIKNGITNVAGNTTNNYYDKKSSTNEKSQQ
jgi:hypothetical protein